MGAEDFDANHWELKMFMKQLGTDDLNEHQLGVEMLVKIMGG